MRSRKLECCAKVLGYDSSIIEEIAKGHVYEEEHRHDDSFEHRLNEETEMDLVCHEEIENQEKDEKYERSV